MLKHWTSSVTYHNKKYFKAGIIDDKLRKRFKGRIPKCDKVYLDFGKGDLFVLTWDEMQAIAMITTEVIWKVMPRIKRY